MKGKLSSGRVEPVVRPPTRATIGSRLPKLKETAQAEVGNPHCHSTEEAMQKAQMDWLSSIAAGSGAERGMICSVD
jgi:hypothetical protein